MKAIKQYIEFAKKNLKKSYTFDIDIDIFEIRWNGYEYVVVYKTENSEDKIALNSMIMRPEFIEAIARGKSEAMWMLAKGLHTKDSIVEYITIKQAIAIRDNKLPEYITNLLGKN